MKKILLLIIIFLSASCIFNPANTKKEIYVYKTVHSFDSNDSLRESFEYIKNDMNITGKVVGAEFPFTKITYDSNGNQIEIIFYDELGQIRTRRINSYLEYHSGIYLHGNYSVFHANDSSTFLGYFDLEGDTLKFRVGEETYYRSKSILDEHGNEIEYIGFNASGDTFNRGVYTYQQLIDDIYVIASLKSYDMNDSIVANTTYTLDGLTLLIRTSGNDHITASSTFDSLGNLIENTHYNFYGEQAQRSTYTYQLLNP